MNAPVKYVSLFSNGTLALITALQVLRITGEVITTPYTFVATTHSLNWNGIKPVFVDVDPVYGNLDPHKIEAAITPKTTAIVPVHVYGNPAEVDKIQDIADIYGLKVIYDAAHAFGINYNGQSILNFGDLSILSFHATKVYNTIEGGAIICQDEKTKKRIDYVESTALQLGYSLVQNKRGRRIGIAVQMPSITEFVRTTFDKEAKYRLMSAVTHGHTWATSQAGFRKIESEQQLQLEKHLDPFVILFLCNEAAESFTKPIWQKAQLFGWDLERFKAIFAPVFADLHSKLVEP